MKTVSTRINNEQHEKFEKVCELLGFTKSQFLRACVSRLVQPFDREKFLEKIGFAKKEVWVKE